MYNNYIHDMFRIKKLLNFILKGYVLTLVNPLTIFVFVFGVDLTNLNVETHIHNSWN